MKSRRIAQLLLATWAIISIGNLAAFLYEHARLAAAGNVDELARGELEFGLALILLVVNFPISVILQFLVPIVAPDGSALASWCEHPVVLWCLLTWMGFIQWAFITPAIGRWLRNRWLARLRSSSKNSLGSSERKT